MNNNERIASALRLRLFRVPPSAREQPEVESALRSIKAWVRADPANAEALARHLAQPLLEIIQHVLASSSSNPNPQLAERWWKLANFLIQSKNELPNMMIHKGLSFLQTTGIEVPPPPAVVPPPFPKPPEPHPRKAQAAAAAPTPGARPVKPVAAPAPLKPHPGPVQAAPAAPRPVVRPVAPLPAPAPPAPPSPPPPREVVSMPADASGAQEPATPPPAKEPSAPPLPLWKFFPVPEGPDKFDEHSAREGRAGEAFRLLGARVRGKKHKHEGTNCDDWFHFEVNGPWTFIAVADGAGSKKFSRVGARASCEAAVGHLASELADHRLSPRASKEEWSSAGSRNADMAFTQPDVERVQAALHGAMHAAYGAVKKAFAERADMPEYDQALGRKLELNDLSATLLLAVHTTVLLKGSEESFVMACQIGDGMSAAITGGNQLVLLGEADSGSFSGETDFLTSKNKLEADNLCRKTFPFIGPLRALLVMTDGVADDYFPGDPELLRLYGDLVLNRILELKGPAAREIAAALGQTRLPTPEQVAGADYLCPAQCVEAVGCRPVRAQSVAAFADRLGLTVADVVASPALLLAGARAELGEDASSEERLRLWLDCYSIRGSFDDRTLVALFRETVS